MCSSCSGLVDDPRYATNAARIERRGELKAIIEARLEERTPPTSGRELLLAADIPAGPINNAGRRVRG